MAQSQAWRKTSPRSTPRIIPGRSKSSLGCRTQAIRAIAVVEQHARLNIRPVLDLVVDTTMHGLNRKVSNLINMWRRVEHDDRRCADSDMRVDSDYLARIVAALEQHGVGAVTCLYHGFRCDRRLGPTRRARHQRAFPPERHRRPGTGPCASLLRLDHRVQAQNTRRDRRIRRRRRLPRGRLCDRRGDCARAAMTIAIPPLTVGHVCAENSARELWQHEVRWARTIRSVDPVGYVGSIITHAFPMGADCGAGGWRCRIASRRPSASGLCIAALLCRLAVLAAARTGFRAAVASRTGSFPCVIYCLSLYSRGLFGRTAQWKGRELPVFSGGPWLLQGVRQRP